MSHKEAEMLVSLITKLVETSGMTWTEKKHLVFKNASDEDRTNINEFASWFDAVV